MNQKQLVRKTVTSTLVKPRIFIRRLECLGLAEVDGNRCDRTVRLSSGAFEKASAIRIISAAAAPRFLT